MFEVNTRFVVNQISEAKDMQNAVRLRLKPCEDLADIPPGSDVAQFYVTIPMRDVPEGCGFSSFVDVKGVLVCYTTPRKIQQSYQDRQAGKAQRTFDAEQWRLDVTSITLSKVPAKSA